MDEEPEENSQHGEHMGRRVYLLLEYFQMYVVNIYILYIQYMCMNKGLSSIIALGSRLSKKLYIHK
jgi:hypothetical protein